MYLIKNIILCENWYQNLILRVFKKIFIIIIKNLLNFNINFDLGPNFFNQFNEIYYNAIISVDRLFLTCFRFLHILLKPIE